MITQSQGVALNIAGAVLRNRRRAFQFFKAHAGYSTPPGRAACALRLARAEEWAEREGLIYLEEDDSERAYCYCDDRTCKYHEGSDLDRGAGWTTIGIVLVRPCEEHGTDCKHAEHLGSLWGIMDPDDAYRRVVRAELALEVMPE